jgi:hypothetical protein
MKAQYRNRTCAVLFTRTPYKRLQRTGISMTHINDLSHDSVVTRPLERSVMLLS